MKIGIDARCLCESRYSGISEYTHNLVKHLLKLDNQNEYLLFYNAAKKTRTPDITGSNVTHKPFHYPNKFFNLALRFTKFTSLDQLLGGVDVFLTPTFLFTNISNKTKKVLVIHDLSFELYPEFFTLKSRLWHTLINPQQVAQQSDHIIAISENTKRDVVRIYGVDPEKVSVVYNGVGDEYFEEITEAQKEKVRAKYKLPKKYIFSLGNLEPRKNVASVIKAFEKIKDQEVELLIGGGQAWKYQKMYKEWENSPIKNRIRFLGYVDAEDKPALFNQALAFVYPSIYEGFGLPPLEAMACGTPVISSFTSSLVESVGNAGLLVDPNNIAEIRAALDAVIADEGLRQKLSEQGIAHARKFRWDEAAQKIHSLLTS